MPESHGVRDLPEDIDDDISCFQITDRCHCGKLEKYITILYNNIYYRGQTPSAISIYLIVYRKKILNIYNMYRYRSWKITLQLPHIKHKKKARHVVFLFEHLFVPLHIFRPQQSFLSAIIPHWLFHSPSGTFPFFSQEFIIFPFNHSMSFSQTFV